MNVKLSNARIEVVDDYNFLGSRIHRDGDHAKGIWKRMETDERLRNFSQGSS